jgi:hypothetical protein
MNQENSKSSKISQMDNLKKREAGENVSIEENDHENETRKSLEDHLRIGASKTKVFIANIKQKGFYQLISAGKSKFESVFMPQLAKKIAFSKTLDNIKSVFEKKDKLNATVNDSEKLLKGLCSTSM